MVVIDHAEACRLGAALMERYRQIDAAREASRVSPPPQIHPCARGNHGIAEHQYMPAPPDYRHYYCRICGREADR